MTVGLVVQFMKKIVHGVFQKCVWLIQLVGSTPSQWLHRWTCAAWHWGLGTTEWMCCHYHHLCTSSVTRPRRHCCTSHCSAHGWLDRICEVVVVCVNGVVVSRGVDVIVARGVMGIVSVEKVSQLVVLWLQFLVFIVIASAPYIKAWIWMSVGGLVIATSLVTL